MIWLWDPEKNRTNRRDHGLDFEMAQLVFDDPLHLSLPDPHPDGDRWRTLGLVGNTLIFVVHTEPLFNLKLNLEVGRVISARRATSHERRAYEEQRP